MPNKVRHIPQGNPLPEWFVDAIQEFISTITSGNFKLSRLNDTTVQIVAGTGSDQVSIGIVNAGVAAWRYITANVSAAHPGGSAGTHDIWVIAEASSYNSNPSPPPDELDETVYDFGLKITTSGTPSGSGSEAKYRKVGTLTWDGTKITSITQLVGPASFSELGGALVRRGLAAERPSASTGNRNLVWFSTDTKAISQNQDGSSWTVLVSNEEDAAAGTASLRSLGTGATQAAAGNDSRLPTTGQKSALAGTSGTPGVGNEYVTDDDPRVNRVPLPAGSVLPFAAAAAPTGFLLCDGAAVSRATYAALFAVIGTTYGAGNGTTTFNVPDMRGRAVVGLGTHADVDTVGKNDGLAVGNRRPKHRHSITDPGHTHTEHNPNYNNNSYASGSAEDGSPDDQTSPTGNSPTGITVGPTPYSTSDPLDAPAYLVLSYIISTG